MAVTAPTLCRRSGLRLAAVVLALSACAGDPARAIEARRALYTATLTGFVVHDLPGAAQPQIALDVLLSGGSTPPLSGLTVDVAQIGADGRERSLRRVWIETAAAGAAPGSPRATTIRFEDLDFRPGDRFSVAVRTPIPAAERGDYRELGGAR